jgi:cytochrome c oxidase subunit 4
VTNRTNDRGIARPGTPSTGAGAPSRSGDSQDQGPFHRDAQEPMDHTTRGAAPSTYWLVFAALMVLLALTVIAARFDAGALSIIVMLTIAIIKALLIVLYFMHVRYSARMVWLFAGASFFWVLIMFVFLFADYLTRQQLSPIIQ